MVRWVVCVTVLALSVSLIGTAKQLLVSKEGLGAYRSVQAALSEAESGDTILVNPGVYEETIEFVSGVTVTGAGADRTVIRYGYGFDEVFHARNTLSGRIERVTLERMTSVLDAPVVSVESAAVTFSECVIIGGQPDGIRVTGLAARVVLDNCTVVGQDVHGILCQGGAEVRVVGGAVRENGGAGILAVDSGVIVDGTRFVENGISGLVLQGATQATVEAATFERQSAWGIDALDASTLELVDCRFTDNARGGVRLRDRATARVQGGRLAGGAVGLDVGGSSTVEILGGTVREAIETGIRVSESASASIQRAEVIECIGRGCELASDGPADVRYATIVGNGGDGILATGSEVAITNSIVALNDGAGLRLSQNPSTSRPPALGYNAVWGNEAGDYVGTSRRPSDLGAYPEFVDPGDEDFALRLGSPCAEAGERGATIGAHLDPTRVSGTLVDVTVRRSGGLWGLDLVGMVRLSDAAPLEEFRLRAGRHWDRAAFSIESSFLGVGSEWLRADGTIRLVDVELGAQSATALRATLGAVQTLDGAGSRSSAWARFELDSDVTSLRVNLDWERPTGISHQAVELVLGGLSFSTEATDFTLNVLDASLGGATPRSPGVLSGSAGLSMLPERRAVLRTGWTTERWGLAATVRAYLAAPASGDVSVSWSDFAYGSRIEVAAVVTDWSAEDVALRAALRLAELSVESEVGVNTALGVRFRLSVGLDTAGWLVPRGNRPPLPAFDIETYEPEAGEPITFNASASADPDGEIAEYWWDFGDGGVDIGNPIAHRYERPGTYPVALTVADTDGDTATLVKPVLVFEADTTPAASFTWGPVSEAGTSLMRPLRAGDLVRFDAGSSYDPDGSIVEYAWDFQSDGSFDLVTDEPLAVADPLGIGTWPVTLRVVNDAGRADAVMRVLRVEEPKPPEAAFDVSPSTPSIYDPVRFVDRSGGADGPIVSWEWALGDGHVSREAEPIHRYEEVGRYEVRLTVTDSLGQSDTHTAVLEVQRNPEVVPVSGVWALVIGISDYEEVEDLPYARRDAEAVARWLLANGVPAERIRLLTDHEADPRASVGVTAAPATLVNVREGLGWLRRVASEDDLVVIHFSGHGYQGTDDGADEADGVDEFFVLYDTRAAAKDDTALRDDEFGRFLDRIASRHVLIFFDSCYSGGLSRSLPPGRRASGAEQDWFGDLRLEGRLLLSASSEGEEAFESPDLEHGVFTHFLLEGLNGAADLNEDYHVTVWELYEYVVARVPGFVEAERGEPQHPQLFGEGETRIVLSLRDRPLEAGFSYCPSVPYSGGPILFSDESASTTIVERVWAFSDGRTASGEHVEHAFREAGIYSVTLTVSDEEGNLSEAQLEVRVESAGRVRWIDPESGHVVISLGARNGIRVGDRFSAEADSEDGGARPTLEVIELIDEDRAACRVVDGAEPALEDRLVPIAPAPCSPAG